MWTACSSSAGSGASGGEKRAHSEHSAARGVFRKRTHCAMIRNLSSFDWSTSKNQQLIDERGISFERVVSAIEQGGLLDVVEHPNRRRYPGQRIYVVEIEGYVHLVPFVTEADDTRFLKTIIPSRKATRGYLRRRQS